ncbi:MAG: AraC family transcriptional regulator [Tannerellaceae bacterium]|nr:AraC family transcriptional regulator [Tannerellaceae bacterium]
MQEDIKTFGFKPLPLEIEIKDLGFVKELPGLLGRPHKANFYQLVWITEGKACFTIDFREIIIRAGEVLIISAGQVCQFDISNEYTGKLILFTASFFTVTEPDGNFLYTSQILNPVSLNKTIPVCEEQMSQLFSLLNKALIQPADSHQLPIAQSYLRILLLETERKLTARYPLSQDTLVRKFCTEVESHFRQCHTIEFYLSLLGINEKALSRSIKQHTGKTPKVYLDLRILLEAKRLLTYSNQTVKEIGYELGFGEPANFNKYFRKHTGITPGAFRLSTQV